MQSAFVSTIRYDTIRFVLHLRTLINRLSQFHEKQKNIGKLKKNPHLFSRTSSGEKSVKSVLDEKEGVYGGTDL